MNPLDKLLIALVISVIVAVSTIILTRRSGIENGRKTLIYILSILAPVVGLLLYLFSEKKIISK